MNPDATQVAQNIIDAVSKGRDPMGSEAFMVALAYLDLKDRYTKEIDNAKRSDS